MEDGRGALVHSTEHRVERGAKLYEAYGGRLTRREAAWVVELGTKMMAMGIIAIASVPLLWLAGELLGFGWSLALLAVLFVVYLAVVILWFRVQRRLSESLAERYGLTAKAARKIEFRRGLDGFDRSLEEARQRST